MSEPKLYRHNESGKVVACDIEGGKYSHVYMWEGCGATPKRIATDRFLSLYTVLPEPPEGGSTAWAWHMLEQGFKVRRKSFVDPEAYCCLVGCKIEDQNGHSSGILYANDWEIYEEPKPIVGCLPHEFVEGQEVLVSDLNFAVQKTKWSKDKFKRLYYNKDCVHFDCLLGIHSHCIPYAGNEPLEGTVTEGEHGAVPKGYVPPHTPKLGDDDYWALNDEVIDLSRNEFYKIHCKTKDNKYFYAKNQDGESIKFRYDGVIEPSKMRVMFHVGSGVNDDGTVNETAPTRPHKIREGE